MIPVLFHHKILFILALLDKVRQMLMIQLHSKSNLNQNSKQLLQQDNQSYRHYRTLQLKQYKHKTYNSV